MKAPEVCNEKRLGLGKEQDSVSEPIQPPPAPPPRGPEVRVTVDACDCPRCTPILPSILISLPTQPWVLTLPGFAPYFPSAQL